MKNKIVLYYPYIATSFLALLPLLDQAIRISPVSISISISLLYFSYFMLLLGVLIIAPAKKIIVFLILVPSLSFSVYRVTNKKHIGLDDVTSALDSNFNESLSFFLTSNNYVLILAPLFMTLFFVFYFKFDLASKKISLIFIFLATVFLYFHDEMFGNRINFFPLKIYKDYRLYKDEIKRIRDGYNNIDTSMVGSSESNDVSVYLVIGESSRKDHYSICSHYKVDGTPMLKKISEKNKSLISFCNAKSVAVNTRYAVTSALSSKSIVDFDKIHNYPNIIHKLNNYGLKSSIYQNNSYPDKSNIHNSLVLLNFIPTEELYFSKNKYDMGFFKEIMPILKKEISALNIIHMKGNHFRYNKTYPDNYLSGDYSSYHKSIRYTDASLSYLINEIENLDRNIILLYFSDHGEYVNDLEDGKYGHGALILKRYAENSDVLNYLTDIPFFIYFNKESLVNYSDVFNNIKNNRDCNISQDNLFHTLYGIMVPRKKNDSSYDNTYDLTSKKFRENTRYVYNSDINYIGNGNAFIRINENITNCSDR